MSSIRFPLAPKVSADVPVADLPPGTLSSALRPTATTGSFIPSDFESMYYPPVTQLKSWIPGSTNKAKMVRLNLRKQRLGAGGWSTH